MEGRRVIECGDESSIDRHRYAPVEVDGEVCAAHNVRHDYSGCDMWENVALKGLTPSDSLDASSSSRLVTKVGHSTTPVYRRNWTMTFFATAAAAHSSSWNTLSQYCN